MNVKDLTEEQAAFVLNEAVKVAAASGWRHEAERVIQDTLKALGKANGWFVTSEANRWIEAQYPQARAFEKDALRAAFVAGNRVSTT